MGQFEGTVVVVTGVGHEGQVGDALARAFADEGATLALVDRQADVVGARAAALVARGGRATAYSCDLTDPTQVSAVAERIMADTGAHPGIDALVNVAGGFAMSGPMGRADVETLRRQIEVNLRTAWVSSNVFSPFIRDGGSIVYFASAAVLPGAHTAGMSAYAAAKAGVIGLMQSVADEGRARHLRANAVAPIAIRTTDNLRTMSPTSAYVEREAIADVVLFLCSPAARAITGQVIRLTD